MKKALVLVAGLVASSMSFADTSTTYNDMHLYSATFATKAEAYKAGFDIKENVVSMDSSKLKNTLMTTGNNVHNVKLGSTKVAVEEFANNDNQVVYRAAVDVNYSYSYND